MTGLPIVIWPHKALREIAEPIDVAAIADAAKVLNASMELHGGVGIAANQVGIPLSIFLISGEILSDFPGVGVGTSGVFANPEIILVGEKVERDIEGCLSFPDIFLHVTRHTQIRIRAQDIEGNTFELEANGFLARAIQHEYDHLKGHLMIDFVGPLKRQMVKKKLSKRR